MKKSDEHENPSDWEERYQQNSTRWERAQCNGALLHWLDAGFVQAGRILVPGCGRSHEPFLLAERGFCITGLDFAPSPIAHQNHRRQSHPNKDCLNFAQADILDWSPSQPFDAIYEQTCLCALHPDQWALYSAQLQRFLRPNGRLLALFMQTGRSGGPPFHCPIEEMHELFPPDKWRWEMDGDFQSEHKNGKIELGRVLIRL